MAMSQSGVDLMFLEFYLHVHIIVNVRRAQ